MICHDLDFPALVRRAGAAGVGLLVAPSDDWKEAETSDIEGRRLGRALNLIPSRFGRERSLR